MKRTNFRINFNSTGTTFQCLPNEQLANISKVHGFCSEKTTSIFAPEWQEIYIFFRRNANSPLINFAAKALICNMHIIPHGLWSYYILFGPISSRAAKTLQTAQPHQRPVGIYLEFLTRINGQRINFCILPLALRYNIIQKQFILRLIKINKID